MLLKVKKQLEEEIEIELPAYRRKGQVYIKLDSPICMTLYSDMIISTYLSNHSSIDQDYNSEVISKENFELAFDIIVNNLKQKI